MKATVAIEASTFSSPSSRSSKNTGNVQGAQSGAVENRPSPEKADANRDSFKAHLDRQARLEDQKRSERTQSENTQKSSNRQYNSRVSDAGTEQNQKLNDNSISSEEFDSQNTGNDINTSNYAQTIDPNIAGLETNEIDLTLQNSTLQIANLDSSAANLLHQTPLKNSIEELSAEPSASALLQSNVESVLTYQNETEKPLRSGAFGIDMMISRGLPGVLQSDAPALSKATPTTMASTSTVMGIGTLVNHQADFKEGQLGANLSSSKTNLSANLLQNTPVNNDVISTKPDFLQGAADKAQILGNKNGAMSLFENTLVGLKTSESDLTELANVTADKPSSSVPMLKATEGLLASASARTQVPVTMSFNQPGWASMVAERTAIMASQKIEVADIQLDPPELGPLQIKVQVQNEQTTVSFVSGSQAVRDSLEQASQRLKDMMEEQGLNLVDVDVSDRENQDDQQQANSSVAGKEPGHTEDTPDDSLGKTAEELSINIKSGIDDFV